VDRRHLEYFLAIVDYAGFTSASHALHVSQPSLSQAIKSLERELGVELFHRTSHGVRLTAAGDSLLGPARQTLREFDAATVAVRNVSRLEAGRLDIVALPGLAADPLVALLADFHRHYPGVEIRIDEAAAEEIFELVRSGESELALAYAPAATAGLNVVAFEAEEALLALPPDSPEKDGATLPATYLNDVRLVVSSGTRLRATAVLAELGVEPTLAAETAHRDAVIPLVLAGVGAAILPPASAREARERGAVVCHIDPPPMRQVLLAYQRRPLTPAAAAFLETVRAQRPDGMSPG
jgi:LysR family carnitine catabolism transcriptional activator